MEFVYRLVGTGWAEAWISDGKNEATLTASYLSDALGNLVEAIGTLLEGASEARCSWDEEPGEYRWVFHREAGQVHLRVLAFQDLWGHAPDENGAVVFETRKDMKVLASAIVHGAEAVLVEHGSEGYKTKWVDHPFPTDVIRLVKDRLGG